MKRLVICCDGTWNSADQEHNGEPCPTNVVRFAYRVAKRDKNGVSQVVFYDQGVGTGNTLDRISGGAFGEGLEDNILDAYRFLFANYEIGDELFVLGFSRGAFTARSLIGMVRKCGILDRKHARQYRPATRLYQSEDDPTAPGPVKFRKDFCLYGDESIDVQFLGVWDTVGALGIPLRGLRTLTRAKHQFHDTELSGAVRNACQALAVDEHRAPFEPAIWENKRKDGQHVEQVWFAGAHSDVGGGYAKVRRGKVLPGQSEWEEQLSDISLGWMMEKAEAAGLAFDQGVVESSRLGLNPLADIHDSRTGLYNVVPEFDRVIGLAKMDGKQTADIDSTQSLHPSVLVRWDQDPKYRPECLKRYFEKVGDPRARAK